ncbi:MAG: hypothetical protein IJ054_04415, partial [Lachnospiraceae bacterium]|nr:hypothetical protein [Lachnospiraceae bacterium]
MREYRKKIKKMLAVLLVISVVMSVIRPQFKNLVFAEEATETVSDDGTVDVSTPMDAVAESVTDRGDTEDNTSNEENSDELSEAVVLTAGVPERGYKVTINAPEGSLPYPADELEVAVREIIPESPEYLFYIKAAAKVLEQDGTESISFARFFDIEILKDGEKVEPLAPVEVKIEYEDAPDIASDEELSIVHFADEGIEVIQDVDLNEDGTKIVYEQGSFSITATIVTDIPEPRREPSASDPATLTEVDNNHDYVLVATCDDKVYTVQNDGSLREVPASNYVKTGNAITKITEETSFMWKYTLLDNDKKYIRYVSDGFDYN